MKPLDLIRRSTKQKPFASPAQTFSARPPFNRFCRIAIVLLALVLFVLPAASPALADDQPDPSPIYHPRGYVTGDYRQGTAVFHVEQTPADTSSRYDDDGECWVLKRIGEKHRARVKEVMDEQMRALIEQDIQYDPCPARGTE